MSTTYNFPPMAVRKLAGPFKTTAKALNTNPRDRFITAPEVEAGILQAKQEVDKWAPQRGLEPMKHYEAVRNLSLAQDLGHALQNDPKRATDKIGYAKEQVAFAVLSIWDSIKLFRPRAKQIPRG